MDRWQLPLEPAYAITTHKMQGATAKFGAVIEPSQTKPFARGLDYVAASRPTELKKLFLLGPLTHNQFNAFPSERNDITLEQPKKNTFSTKNKAIKHPTLAGSIELVQ